MNDETKALDRERVLALCEVALDPALQKDIPPSWWASFGKEMAPLVLAHVSAAPTASPDLVSAAEWLEKSNERVELHLWGDGQATGRIGHGPMLRHPTIRLAILAAATSLGWGGK